MGGACGMHCIGDEYIVLAGEGNLEDLSIGARLILEWFLKK
jgi:hypothetical protein